MSWALSHLSCISLLYHTCIPWILTGCHHHKVPFLCYTVFTLLWKVYHVYFSLEGVPCVPFSGSVPCLPLFGKCTVCTLLWKVYHVYPYLEGVPCLPISGRCTIFTLLWMVYWKHRSLLLCNGHIKRNKQATLMFYFLLVWTTHLESFCVCILCIFLH